MGLIIDFAAPPSRRATRQDHRPSARSVLPPRGVPLRATPRVISTRSLLASCRAWCRGSGWTPFASSSPEARTAIADDEALTYPEQMAALGRVVASTRGVLAAQAHVAAHKAARSHAP